MGEEVPQGTVVHYQMRPFQGVPDGWRLYCGWYLLFSEEEELNPYQGDNTFLVSLQKL